MLRYVTFCLQPPLGWMWCQISAGMLLEGRKGQRVCSDFKPNWVTVERSAWFMDRRGLQFFFSRFRAKTVGQFLEAPLLFIQLNLCTGGQQTKWSSFYSAELNSSQWQCHYYFIYSFYTFEIIWIKATYLTFLESWTFCKSNNFMSTKDRAAP